MYFRQILHPDLGCASYLIADCGEAAVIDPTWEIDEYRKAAAGAGAEIRHVLETHNHADHVSGRRRLTAATRATAHVPAGPDQPGVRDGETVRVGELEVVALATPGHRPEHVAYLVRDEGIPRLLLSGDSLLVGDVARPDLAVAAEEGARALWDTLKRLLALGDEVEVWPAHVGGSLCASRSASSATSSTIGQERQGNPLLSFDDTAAFTAEVTRCMPTRPPSVERVVSLNLLGAAEPGPVRDGFNGIHRFARTLPLAKALDHDVLLADEMNGELIPVERGGPVRAIVPGWYATDSVKWLDRIWFTDQEFDGVFQAHDYRLRAPGEPGPGRRMAELPVNALITTPADGETTVAAGEVSARGIAWGGTDGISEVLVRVDHGPWIPTRLGPVRGPYARVLWEAQCTLAVGPHEITCRATDRAGRTQPDRPLANVRGYANNAVHHVSLTVE